MTADTGAAPPASPLTLEQLQAEFAARRHSLRRDPRGRLRVTHQAHGLSRELADLAEAEKLLRIMGWRPT